MKSFISIFYILEQSDAQLEVELKKADVVCIVYAVDDEDTLDSVTDHWLPFIERTLGFEHRTPLILVGNKVDLVEYRYYVQCTYSKKSRVDVKMLTDAYLCLLMLSDIFISRSLSIFVLSTKHFYTYKND